MRAIEKLDRLRSTMAVNVLILIRGLRNVLKYAFTSQKRTETALQISVGSRFWRKQSLLPKTRRMNSVGYLFIYLFAVQFTMLPQTILR